LDFFTFFFQVVQVKILDKDFEKNILMHANDMIEFFEAIAKSGLISLAPNLSTYPNSENVFMIQLPRKGVRNNWSQG